MLGFSDITTKRLQYDVAGPRTIQAYRKARSEKQALIVFSYSWWVMLGLHFDIWK